MHYRAVGYWGLQKTDCSLKQGGGPISLLFVFWQETWSSEDPAPVLGPGAGLVRPLYSARDILPVKFQLYFLSSLFFYLYFLQTLCSALTPPFVIPTTIMLPIFFPLLLISYSSLPVTVLTHTNTHTLDIRINSLDFSAHNLTVNRKWLTWISILRYEHGARAAFVYTIMLLKAFTLTNCLRSKEEKKKREIQLSEMWEGEEKRWIWSTDDSMYLSKHPHVLKKKNCQSVCWTQSTDSGRLSRLRGGWQANIININILLWMNCMYSCLLLWPRPSIDGWCTLYWQLLSYRRT